VRLGLLQKQANPPTQTHHGPTAVLRPVGAREPGRQEWGQRGGYTLAPNHLDPELVLASYWPELLTWPSPNRKGPWKMEEDIIFSQPSVWLLYRWVLDLFSFLILGSNPSPF
jgi:hypothetical protein